MDLIIKHDYDEHDEYEEHEEHIRVLRKITIKWSFDS